MKTDTRFVDDEDLDTCWPRDGDSLFPKTERAIDTFIAGRAAERFYRLPKGYKAAGDILTEQISAGNIHEANLIFPALFCYRQSLELFLKSILERFGQGTRNTHDLKYLWDEYKRLVDERGHANTDGLEAAAKLVTEMHAADRRSDAFRFATDSSGGSFDFGDRRLDVVRLREAMQALQNFFECCYLSFSEKDDYPR
jgi:hypothetical protein